MAVNTMPAGGSTRRGKDAFGSFDGRELLIWLKDIALEPCKLKSSHHGPRNQMLKVRRLMNTSDPKNPQKKRKFEHYMNDGKLATYVLISGEKYGNRNAKNWRKGESSSLSCSPLSDEKWGSLQGTQGLLAFPPLNDRAEYCNVSRQDYSHLSDYDESIKGPNPMKQGNLKSHLEDLVISSSYTHSTQTSIKEEPQQQQSLFSLGDVSYMDQTTPKEPHMEYLEELKSLVNEDFDESSATSHSLSSEQEGRELNQQLKKFLPSDGNNLPRLVIPIGPRFQAEIPKWEGSTYIRHHNSDDDLKWLGTEIWPMPDILETNTKGIGNGRPESCSCDFPGSVDCVQQHISEARELLQSEIGIAFSSWKFDEMGEDVSKSWTVEEQKEFESLVRLNPLSNDTDFWKLAMEHFPSKSLKSMVNYYYNVCIPRRMSKETRSSFGAVDSDDDQNVDYKNEDDCSTTRKRIIPICKLRKSRVTDYDEVLQSSKKPQISLYYQKID